MKTTFLKSETNFGCYSISQADSFLPEANFTIGDVLIASVPLKDKAWFIRNNCQFTQYQYREFAIGCALCVLPIYESKYPENKAPREAIEAAKSYLKKEIGLEELITKRRAAAAAYAAAYYADASDAAAYAAAYYAAYAAYAAAYYADASDAAAYAAYSAADAADASDAAAYAAAYYAAAAADAAYSAADAADASDAAAYAAAAAYSADADAAKEISYTDLLLQFFIEFTKE